MNVTIVGTGPSLLKLTRDDFPEGPVIVLNSAITEVRKLQLSNEIHSFQKDTCIEPPIPPERLINSAIESPHCFTDYPLRRVLDVTAEFGLAPNTMSIVCAVRIAHEMGAMSIRMLAMDGAFRGGDSRRVMPDGKVRRMPAHRYWVGGRQSMYEAKRFGLDITWG